MKKIVFTFLLALNLVVNISFANSKASGELDQVQLHKVVEITSSAMPELVGKPFQEWGVFAYKDEQLKPIPFQFEQYDEKGFLFQGKVEGVDEKRVGVLGQQDLLVIMLKDAGERATNDQLKGLSVITSLEISDRGVTRYIYVIKSLARSSERYVTYNSKTGLIAMPEAVVYMNPKDLLDWGDVFAKEGDKLSEKSFMDTLIVRISGSFMKIPIRLNNKNLQAKLQNVYEGPVRLTLDAQFRAIVAKIPVIRAHAQLPIDSYSARLYLNLNAPMKYAELIKEPQVLIGIDGNELYGGFVKTSVSGDQRFIVDGKMDEHELALNDLPVDDDVSWIWLSDEKDFNIIGQFDVSSRDDYDPDEFTDVTVFYRDDKNHNDKLERFPGSLPTLGYRLNSIPASENAGMSYRVFFINGLKPLGAGEYLSRLDNPVKVMTLPDSV